MRILHVLYSGLGGHGNVFFSLVKADKLQKFEYQALFNGIETVRNEYIQRCNELKIPFTTGILVGIGDTREDRILALEAIAESHAKYGHVQEVIVQNFLPKPLTGMQHSPACPQDEYLWSIAAARVILPPEIHLQAPPNLSDDFGLLLDAGIDDWGGVSPVTADHVNPERPWPALDKLRSATEKRGKVLAPTV